MYYVYIIKSLSYNTRYVGSSDDAKRRLAEHNRGECRYTKGRRPWAMMYQELYQTRSEAMKREKFLKSGQGRKLLDKILSEAGGSSNGRTSPSEGEYLGSNPGPAAKEFILIC